MYKLSFPIFIRPKPKEFDFSGKSVIRQLLIDTNKYKLHSRMNTVEQMGTGFGQNTLLYFDALENVI